MPTRPLADSLFRWEWLAPRYWHRWLSVGALRLLQALPVALRLALGAWHGRRLSRRDGARRLRVEAQITSLLRHCNETERRRLTRRHFEQAGQCALDRGLWWWGDPESWDKRLRMEGEEYLLPLLTAGCPVVLFTCPHVAQEVAEIALHRRYFMTLSLLQSCDDGPEGHLARRGRLRSGGVFLEPENQLQVVRLVRDGHLLLWNPRTAGGRERSVRLFGGTAAISLSIASMARLCRAVVVPYMGYHRQGHYEVRLFPPIEIAPPEQERRNAARLGAALERMIARGPEQLLWSSFHPAARTPGGERCGLGGIAPVPRARGHRRPHLVPVWNGLQERRCQGVPPGGGEERS